MSLDHKNAWVLHKCDLSLSPNKTTVHHPRGEGDPRYQEILGQKIVLFCRLQLPFLG